MRKNQEILDEAARSVRRTFVGSLAGSVTMLGVIGAAGAYGMPERLSAHALSGALTSLQFRLTPMVEGATPIVDRAVIVADNFKQRVQPVAIESDDEVILQVPRAAFALASASPVQRVEPSRIQALAAPVTEPISPPVDVIVMPDTTAALPVEKPVAAMPVEKPAVAPVATAALQAPAIPAPMRPARTMPGAMPDVINEPVVAPSAVPSTMSSAIPAPMVFEQPQLDKIKPLTEMPKFEIVETPKAVQHPAKPEKAVQIPAKPEPQKAVPVSAAPEKPKVIATLVAPDAPKPVETRTENSAEKPAGNAAENPAMSAMASAVDMSSSDDFPKPVSVVLPLPRPPMSPAQLLDLHEADYEKSAKCLAQAIYFEARAEPVRGQQAVAQVVLNRVFSPYYPKDVCSVVYQNAHRHLSCQFTFACDGKPEAIRERGAWARANRIARQALDAKVWLPDVAKATHYHATYVKPDWIRDMKVLVKTGVHIFYRPRNWGDGSKELGWGTPSAAAAAAPVPTPAHKKGVKS